jgi:hypothetical protein
MSFEPRMRGRRSGRPITKKKSARDRREQHQASTFYAEQSPIAPSQVRSTTLNQLEHLGNQRFVLPPFSEHFQRWIKDITGLLSDFESQLPAAVDDQYRKSVEKTLTDLRLALVERTEAETAISTKRSDLQRQLAEQENKLTKLDHDYKMRSSEARREHQLSLEKLRSEIGTLDRERLRILRRRPSLLQKLLHRPNTGLEETTGALRSKKDALGERKQTFEQDAEKRRMDYENKRRLIVEELRSLQSELEKSQETKLDDALDVRKAACKELQRAVSGSTDRLFQQPNPENSKDTGQPETHDL